MEKDIKKYILSSRNLRFDTIDLEKKVKRCYLVRSLSFDYKEFASVIDSFEKKGLIEPIKSSKMNAMHPPLYKRYTKVIEKIEALPAVELIKFHPLMQLARYKESRSNFEKDKEYLNMISEYLFKEDVITLTVNERSFEIFEDEKFLSSNRGRKLLLSIGVSLNDLNSEKTYEPFFYYRRPGKVIENVLIIENKDTFHSFKKLMFEGICEWDGVNFQLLIYGEGNKITKSINFADEAGIPDNAVFFYFGDVDREGISIKSRLEELSCRPVYWMDFFYKECWKVGESKRIKSKNNQKFNKLATESFVSIFDENENQKVYDFIEKGLFIPQEALNQRKLRRLGKDAQS